MKIGFVDRFYTSRFGALGFGEEGGVLGFGSVKENLTFSVCNLRIWRGSISCRRSSVDTGLGVRLVLWLAHGQTCVFGRSCRVMKRQWGS